MFQVEESYNRVEFERVSNTESKPSINSTSNASTNKPSCRSATASIFVPRTKEMNKGFLTFSDDQNGSTSKSYEIRTYIIWRRQNIYS